MQKVEGSSPFSRSQESPPNRRVFCWSKRRERQIRVAVQQLCTTNGVSCNPAGPRSRGTGGTRPRCGEAGDRRHGAAASGRGRSGRLFVAVAIASSAAVQRRKESCAGTQDALSLYAYSGSEHFVAAPLFDRQRRRSRGTRFWRPSRSINRPVCAALLFRQHSHRSDQSSLPDRAESSSLAETAASATERKLRLRAAEFRFDPIISNRLASRRTDECSVSALCRSGATGCTRPAMR
jgi:hypothetical protein